MPKTPSPKTAKSPAKRKRPAAKSGPKAAASSKSGKAEKGSEATSLKARPARKPKKAKARPSAAALAVAALEDMKAQHVVQLDVRHLTTVTDTMIIPDGRSDRHVRSLADAVVERCEQAGIRPLGVEGQDAGEWVLVDIGDVVVHVMLPRVREFYNLEKLWGVGAQADAAVS